MEMHSEKERWRELQCMLQDGLTDNQQNYADFFKYLANKEDGIPGYIKVDPVKNTSEYVELEQAMELFCISVKLAALEQLV